MNTVLNSLREENVKGIAYDVAEILANQPNLTVGEIHLIYKKKNPKTSRSRNEIAKRVSDLYSLRVVKPTSKTVCPTTGRVANTWMLTGNSPQKEVKAPKIVSASRDDVRMAIITLDKLHFRALILSKLPFIGKKYNKLAKELETVIAVIESK